LSLFIEQIDVFANINPFGMRGAGGVVVIASFEFYTADDPTSYTVIIEGLTDEGDIIRHEGRVWRRE